MDFGVCLQGWGALRVVELLEDIICCFSVFWCIFVFSSDAFWCTKNKVLASVRVMYNKVRVKMRGRSTGNCVL
jgi:hypothetical protein